MNAQDTNGNTVLHMCVIHENLVCASSPSSIIILPLNDVSGKQGFPPIRSTDSVKYKKCCSPRCTAIDLLQEMLRLVIEMGASLRIQNKQKLTALTLAAKLAKKRVSYHRRKIL